MPRATPTSKIAATYVGNVFLDHLIATCNVPDHSVSHNGFQLLRNIFAKLFGFFGLTLVKNHHTLPKEMGRLKGLIRKWSSAYGTMSSNTTVTAIF